MQNIAKREGNVFDPDISETPGIFRGRETEQKEKPLNPSDFVFRVQSAHSHSEMKPFGDRRDDVREQAIQEALFRRLFDNVRKRFPEVKKSESITGANIVYEKMLMCMDPEDFREIVRSVIKKMPYEKFFEIKNS